MWTVVRLLLTVTVRPCLAPPGRLLPAPCRRPPPLSCRTISRDRPGVMSAQPQAETDTAAASEQRPQPTQATPLTQETSQPKEPPAGIGEGQSSQEGRAQGASPTAAPSRDSPTRKAPDREKLWAAFQPQNQQQRVRTRRRSAGSAPRDGAGQSPQQKSPKRKRHPSESSGGGNMSGDAPRASAVGKSDREALQTAAEKLLAALTRPGERTAAKGQSVAQEADKRGQQSNPRRKPQAVDSSKISKQQHCPQNNQHQNPQPKQQPRGMFCWYLCSPCIN